MIEDGFIISGLKGDSGNAYVYTKCKRCNHQFDVHVNAMKPMNCTVVLGESLSVTCPKCGLYAISQSEPDHDTAIDAQLLAIEQRVIGISAQYENLQTDLDELCDSISKLRKLRDATKHQRKIG